MDYVTLIASLKANLSAPLAPVIAWGGSYGGMLTAWWEQHYLCAAAGTVIHFSSFSSVVLGCA
jgi:lysosomal Pro-X carboxypeptidase